MDYGDNDVLSSDEHLENWVMAKCDSWRDHYESNYAERFEEFYRLWRGIWAAEDMERKSERSRIISPALQQAVESSVAEIEEATFGRGKLEDGLQVFGADLIDRILDVLPFLAFIQLLHRSFHFLQCL